MRTAALRRARAHWLSSKAAALSRLEKLFLFVRGLLLCYSSPAHQSFLPVQGCGAHDLGLASIRNRIILFPFLLGLAQPGFASSAPYIPVHPLIFSAIFLLQMSARGQAVCFRVPGLRHRVFTPCATCIKR